MRRAPTETYDDQDIEKCPSAYKNDVHNAQKYWLNVHFKIHISSENNQLSQIQATSTLTLFYSNNFPYNFCDVLRQETVCVRGVQSFFNLKKRKQNFFIPDGLLRPKTLSLVGIDFAHMTDV